MKLNYDDLQARTKTLEQRYSQVKIAHKSASEDLIEFKEKALQFDSILTHGKELDA